MKSIKQVLGISKNTKYYSLGYINNPFMVDLRFENLDFLETYQ